MAPDRFAHYLSALDPIFKLPHPYLTAYHVVSGDSADTYQLQAREQGSGTTSPPAALQTGPVFFTEPDGLKSGDRPANSNNTPWARARRSPQVTIHWKQQQAPSPAQLWLAAYALVTLRPDEESFRLRLFGFGASATADHLKAVSLAVDHPLPTGTPVDTTSPASPAELLLLRAAFWQGAGSPFGPRPVWLPSPLSLASFPPQAETCTLPSATSAASTLHPRRPVKPQPGTVFYSRYIPHLRETFSMVALDYRDDAHLALFHAWQNDPRVSQGWDQAGKLDEHRAYLREVEADPHQFAILARFEDTAFAYFEAYWAKEDRLGSYYTAGDFDRGRHSLVGDVRFRGPHRVTAWWSSLMHYLFLDEPRTARVVGEPKATNTSVLMYDLMHGFGIEKFVDLPHKRAALVSCSRERFFQLCPLGEGEKVVGGTRLGVVPKL